MSSLAIFAVGMAAIGVILLIASNAQTCGNTDKGDLNCDNKVDLYDLSMLLSQYGQTGSPYDINGDQVINLFDLSILLSNYSANLVAVAPTPAPVVVPTPVPPPVPPTANAAGHISYMFQTSTQTDRFSNNPTLSEQQWMRDHYQRSLVYSSYWDSRLSWYPNGWAYADTYAIYVGSELASQHPEWILKDGGGNKLYIPFGCSGGTCPQYAADIGNPAYRQYYIDNARALMNIGYKGIFADDVDMDINVGNGSGASVAPIDPRSSTIMSDTVWKSYFADFMEQLRADLPNAELVHNSVWFAGGGLHDASNPYIVRQIKAADYINMERGFNDGGLTGGTGIWSVSALMAYIDKVHLLGRHVIIQSYGTDTPAIEYNLAGYLLINDGKDYVSTTGGSNPDAWWSGYDSDLGSAQGARYTWNGLSRRDFDKGMVLLNEPNAATKTVALGGTFKNTSGQSVTSVTLSGSSGAVLTK